MFNIKNEVLNVWVGTLEKFSGSVKLRLEDGRHLLSLWKSFNWAHRNGEEKLASDLLIEFLNDLFSIANISVEGDILDFEFDEADWIATVTLRLKEMQPVHE